MYITESFIHLFKILEVRVKIYKLNFNFFFKFELYVEMKLM